MRTTVTVKFNAPADGASLAQSKGVIPLQIDCHCTGISSQNDIQNFQEVFDSIAKLYAKDLGPIDNIGASKTQQEYFRKSQENEPLQGQ